MPFSRARRLQVLRPFARYLARLDPATESPDTAIFGRSDRRLAPHLNTDQESGDLLAAAVLVLFGTFGLISYIEGGDRVRAEQAALHESPSSSTSRSRQENDRRRR